MRRQLRAVLVGLLISGSLLATALPSWGEHNPAECDPGLNCTGFKKGQYEVFESDGFVKLDVSAAWGPPAEQGQIDYYTSDLNAQGGPDYQPTSGTLTFAANGGQSIRVLINFDSMLEGEERFEVTLTNFRGNFHRGREKAVVRILDDPPRPSSGVSTARNSTEQPTEPSAAPPVESAPPGAAAGSAGAGDSSAQPQDPAGPSPRGPRVLRPYAATAPPPERESLFGLVASLAALLLVIIAGIRLVLKRRFR